MKRTKQEVEKITQTLFETYFHFDKIEALLSNIEITRLPIKTDFMLELESIKIRSKRIRKLFDETLGEQASAEYGEKFDELNDILAKHMKITVTD